jgi:hypothetical protein
MDEALTAMQRKHAKGVMKLEYWEKVDVVDLCIRGAMTELERCAGT